MISEIRLLIPVVLAALVVSGCKRGTSLKTVPVEGTVTFNGAPLTDAVVTFFPLAGEDPPANGTTDAEGKFKLQTYVSPTQILDGAVAGQYRVSVVKSPGGTAIMLGLNSDDEATRKAAEDKMANLTGDEMGQMFGAGVRTDAEGNIIEDSQPKAPASLIPERYADPAASQLTATVPAAGPLSFDLNP